jgi:uncharacterized repeat protein (TIGR01451 family)
MNNLVFNFMNKYFKKISSIVVVFALVLTAFIAPVSTVTAFTHFDSPLDFDTSFDFGDLSSYFTDGTANTNQSGQVVVDSNSSFTSCVLEASRESVTVGESITLSWSTTGFDTIKINGQLESSTSGSKVIDNLYEKTTFVLEASNDSGSKCVQQVVIECEQPDGPEECELQVEKTVDKNTAILGEELTYIIEVKNVGDANCTGGVKIEDVVDNNISYESYQLSDNLNAGYGSDPVYTSSDRTLRFSGNILTPGEVGTITWVGKVNTPAQCGDFEVQNQAKATAYELNNFQNWASSQIVKTAIDNDCTTPTPTCDMFTANPTIITVGGSSTLSWNTSNGTQVFINNGIGEVSLDGSISVSPLADIIYKLTVLGADNKVANCEVPITVSENQVPICELFTATPNSLPYGGGSVALNWSVLNASTATITPTVGAVSLIGSRSVNVTESTNFILTAIDNDGDVVTCPASVMVGSLEPKPFTCENNVSFSASDNSITKGDEITLTWNTTDVDSVFIDGINATTLSGSQKVSPASDITYALTATQDNKTIHCPVSVDVSSGSVGGSRSSSPRCDLKISDSEIKSGEEIVLKWNTTNATEVTLTDDHGKIILSTDDYLANDKKDYYDSSIKLKPTRDTKYTLLAEHGTRDEECVVSVKIEDGVVVLETRDQKPLVVGISLSQVPYTGFAAGPFMTVMFYLLLVLWALYISYVLVIRKRAVSTGVEIANLSDLASQSMVAMKQTEETRPDVFSKSITTVQSPTSVSPINFPVGKPVVGYKNYNEELSVVNPHQVNDVIVTELENHAHAQKALLSSDAVRHLVGIASNSMERTNILDTVIAEAKRTYPLEDGWVVINESRMQNLCIACQVGKIASSEAPFMPVIVPEGAGSLAEAIVTGNVVAAYEMIGNRPMLALADAATDLDGVYRLRLGETVHISELLISETKDLSDEKIKNVISALTSALDGVYTDEASAVKMAIMKAVKEAS